ncbi:uncharacterized protein LOC144132792 [Amblyomma americanum]
MKLDREALSYQMYAADTSPPHIYPRERPPAATVYQEFCPLTVPKEGQHPVHTVTDSSNVGSRDKVEAAVQAAEIRRHQSNELFNFPKDAYCPAKDMTGSYDSSHGDEVIERATQTKPRPRRLAGKPRVKFALNARDTAPSKSADLAENVLETIVQFLSTEDLLICRRVCWAWKRIVERPQHWLRIDLNHTSVSAELFSKMAAWCSATESLSLQALEATADANKRVPGAHLEHGLEKLLMACSKTLKVLTVVGSDNLLTHRFARALCGPIQTSQQPLAASRSQGQRESAAKSPVDS